MTNFLAKALLWRLLSRSVTRLALEAVAIPITGLWDAWVVRTVLREARIRVMGPSAVNELLPQILPPEFLPTAEGRIAMFRAVGCTIVRTADMHPNLVVLLKQLHQTLGSPGEETIDQSELFLTELPKLPDREKEIILKLLALAAIIDGRLNRREKRLLKEAWMACGKEFDLKSMNKLLNDFVMGRSLCFI